VKAAYSHQTFPPVVLSVCPVRCGKTADRISMLFGMVGWMDLGMRQMVGFGDRSTGRGNFLGDVECPIVTSGQFVTSHPLPKSLWGFVLYYACKDRDCV